MKRKLILTSIFLILGWSMMAQQVCPDKINNTTDPANPLDYRGNDPIINLHINLNPDGSGDPKLDWMEEPYRYYYKQGGTTIPQWCEMDNPFYVDDNGVNVNQFYNSNPLLRENLPADGWELLAFDFGINYNGLNSSRDMYYMVLYNKHSGTMRVFYYLRPGLLKKDYTAGTVKLSFDEYDAPDKESNNLNHMVEVSKPLDLYEKQQNQSVPTTVYAGIGTTDPCTNGMWLHADFIMAYDPCVCENEYRKFKIEFNVVTQASVQLTGDITSTPISKSGSAPSSGIVDAAAKYKTGFKTISTTVKEGMTYYKSSKDAIIPVYKGIKKLSGKTEALNTLIDQSANVPYIGAAIGVFNYFVFKEVDKNAAKSESGPVTYNSTVNINGTITDSAWTSPVFLEVPGSDYLAQSGTANIEGEIPMYDEPLGVISMVNTPRVEFSHSRPQNVDGAGNFQPFITAIDLPVVTEYKIEDDLELVVNPSSELELTEVKASVVLTYNVNPLKSFENGLLPTELLNYPYVPGATFDVLATATGGFPAITLNVGGYANDDWELLEKSNANLELIVSDELYKVSYGQAPITCFSNTNFYLISAEEPTVELLPHIAIRLNITMKHPVTQINYKFVQSYDVDKSQMFEVDRGLQFYGIDGQALIDLEESEPLTQQLIPLRLLPIVGPGTGNNIFQTSKNIPDFRFFENETIGGFVDAWDGIIIGDNVTIEPGTWITAGRYIDVQSENNYLGEVHMQIGIRDQTCLDNPNNFVSTGSDLSTFCDGSATIKYDPVYAKRTEIVESEEVVARSLDFSLYPNPTDNLANINLPELEAGTYTLTVLDLRGMTVFSETRAYAISGEQTFSIGTADYTSGVYFVTLSQGDLTKTKKLVIAK